MSPLLGLRFLLLNHSALDLRPEAVRLLSAQNRQLQRLRGDRLVLQLLHRLRSLLAGLETHDALVVSLGAQHVAVLVQIRLQELLELLVRRLRADVLEQHQTVRAVVEALLQSVHTAIATMCSATSFSRSHSICLSVISFPANSIFLFRNASASSFVLNSTLIVPLNALFPMKRRISMKRTTFASVPKLLTATVRLQSLQQVIQRGAGGESAKMHRALRHVVLRLLEVDVALDLGEVLIELLVKPRLQRYKEFVRGLDRVRHNLDVI